MSGYSHEILADGPVAYFPMQETSGNVVDVVSGVVGVINGGITSRTVPYPEDNARDFDGNSSYFFVSAASMEGIYWNGTDYSVEWWCRPDSLSQDAIVSQRSGASSSDQGISIFSGTAGVGTIVIDMGNSGTRSSGEYVFKPGEWHHFVYVWEQETSARRLYVDGVQVSWSTKAGTPPTYPAPMHIGLLGGNSTYDWDGAISHLSLYRKALTPDRIKLHYLASGVEGSLVYVGGEWKHKPLKYFDGTTWRPVALRKAV